MGIRLPFFAQANSNSARSAKSSSRKALSVQKLEDRRLLTATGMEIYALSVVNMMRADPPAFARQIEGMVNETISGAHGYSVDDPIWKDLRATLNHPQANRANFKASMQLLKAQQPRGPLAWDDTLSQIASGHNNWMKSNCLAHSAYGDQTDSGCLFRLPGLSQTSSNFPTSDRVTVDRLGDASDGTFLENIGFDLTSSLSNTRSAHPVGSDAQRQRQAYGEVIDFITEAKSANLAHVTNLLAFDTDKRTGNFFTADAMAMDYDLLDNFGKSPVGTSFVVTHSFSNHRGEGGYVTGLIYDDLNSNGIYDLGEGQATSWSITSTDDGGISEQNPALSARQFGQVSHFLPNGSYRITTPQGFADFSIQDGSTTLPALSPIPVTPAISLAVSNINVTESDNTLTFSVTLSQPTTIDIDVPIDIGGSATAGQDYATIPTTIQIEKNTTTATIRVDLRDDVAFENTETLIVSLGNPTGATLGSVTSQTVSIHDNDENPVDRPTELLTPKFDGAAFSIPGRDAGNDLQSGFIFQALANTEIVIETTGESLKFDDLVIVDRDLQAIGQYRDGRFIANIVANQQYAIIISTNQTKQLSVQATAGPSAVSRHVPTNLINPTDVNGDGKTSARDALQVINQIGVVETPEQIAARVQGGYFDVTGEGNVTAKDALRIINELNHTEASSEPSPSDLSVVPDTETKTIQRPTEDDLAPQAASRENPVDQFFKEVESTPHILTPIAWSDVQVDESIENLASLSRRDSFPGLQSNLATLAEPISVKT